MRQVDQAAGTMRTGYHHRAELSHAVHEPVSAAVHHPRGRIDASRRERHIEAHGEDRFVAAFELADT